MRSKLTSSLDRDHLQEGCPVHRRTSHRIRCGRLCRGSGADVPIRARSWLDARLRRRLPAVLPRRWWLDRIWSQQGLFNGYYHCLLANPCWPDLRLPSNRARGATVCSRCAPMVAVKREARRCHQELATSSAQRRRRCRAVRTGSRCDRSGVGSPARKASMGCVVPGHELATYHHRLCGVHTCSVHRPSEG